MAKDEQQQPLSFEAALDELEQVVRQLESGDLPLEESLRIFERGTALSASCRKQLEEAETRVEILMKKDGKIEPEPFPARKP